MVSSSNEQGMAVVDLRFESLRDLQENFGPYLSPEGFFLRDRADFSASDVLRFRLMLPGDFVLVEGIGVVVWVRTPAEAGPTTPFGAAVGFATLSDQGRELVERIVHTHVDGGGKPFEMSRPDGMEVDSEGKEAATVKSGPDLRFSVRGQPDGEELPGSQPEPVAQGLPFDDHPEPEPEPEPELELVPVVDPEAEGIEWETPEAVARDVVEPTEPPRAAEPAIETPAPAPSGPDRPLDDEPRAKPFDFADEADDPGQALFGSAPGLEASIPEVDAGRLDVAGTFTMPDEPVSTAGDPEISLGLGEVYGEDLPPKKGGFRWVAWLAVIGLLGAASWWLWSDRPVWLTELLGGAWFGSGETEVAQVDPGEAMGDLSEEDLEAAVVAAVEAVTTESKAGSKTDDADDGSDQGEGVPRPDTTSGNATDSGETSVGKPEAPAVASDVVSRPANRIVDIHGESDPRGTAVMIRGNGAIDVGRIRTSELSDPPRILLRILGITDRYRPLEHAVGGAELRSIRIGHHPETNPPSLWIVLDRVDDAVRLGDIQSSGNVLRIVVSRSEPEGS